MHFVVAIYEVTTHAPKVFSVFFFERCVFLLLFSRWQPFHCPSSHVFSCEGRRYNPCTNGISTHLRKLNAVHPDRPNVRAPIALALTRRATLLRSQAFVLVHEGNLTPPLLRTKNERTKAKDTPAHSTR